MSEYTYETIPIGGVFMEERFYSFDELRQLLKAQEIMDKHLKQSMGEVKAKVRGEK